jgi:hypothetical protein
MDVSGVTGTMGATGTTSAIEPSGVIDPPAPLVRYLTTTTYHYDVDTINQLPEVLEAKSDLMKLIYAPGFSMLVPKWVRFTIPLTESIASGLTTAFGVDLSGVTELPMQWVMGDFNYDGYKVTELAEEGFMVYLTTTPGIFSVNGVTMPITENSGFRFDKNVSRSTSSTYQSIRLILGPINKYGQLLNSDLLDF